MTNTSAIVRTSLAISMGGSSVALSIIIDGIESAPAIIGTVWRQPFITPTSQPASQERPTIQLAGKHLQQPGEEFMVTLSVTGAGNASVLLPSRIHALSTDTVEVELLSLTGNDVGVVMAIITVGGVASTPAQVAVLESKCVRDQA